ncbi:MAG: DUF4915 domain-containing protein [Candidatus Kerfeldbacteria bacterium]|nr:DUF4915 domain-containing protein [Candidatus Kerfeldbacteria bacterium]
MQTSIFLITFCNQDLYTPVETNLLLLDIERGTQQWIITGNQSGLTGVGVHDEYVFVLHQGSRPGILVLAKKNFTVIAKTFLSELVDPHSLVVQGNTLFVVSTGTDSVLEYQFDPIQRTIQYVRVLWKPEQSLGTQDQYHINSIVKHQNDLYISAFGPKAGETWKTALHGFVYNVTAQDPLDGYTDIYHPHSLVMDGQDLYFCESTAREVRKNNETVITLPNGYVRGLTVTNDVILVGTSQGRKVSKSTGQVNNFFEQEGEIDAVCGVSVFDKKTLEQIHEYNFFPLHREIYEIVPIESIRETASLVYFGVQNVVDDVVQFKHAIEQKQHTIEERDASLNTLRHAQEKNEIVLAERTQELHQAHAKIQQKDQEMNQLQQMVNIAQQHTEQLQERVEEQKDVIVEQKETITEQKQLVNTLKENVQQAYAVIHDKDRELLSMQESKFWKLRGAYMQFKQFILRK